jgi:site-specific DNA-methyltransferase (adenine-specific)
MLTELPKPYYQDDWVTILHGDCRELLSSLDDSNIGLMLTDPPYNVNLGGKNAHSSRQKGYVGSSDKLDDSDYEKLVLPPLFWGMGHAKCTMITPGNSNQTIYPTPKWTMAWFKKNGVTRTPLTVGIKMNHACWEPILVYGKLDNPPHFDYIELPISIQPSAEDHPCPKPLKLFCWLISMVDGVVLDPFVGSGTTLRAAKDLKRKAIGIEIEEKYCEIAARRMAQEVLI